MTRQEFPGGLGLKDPALSLPWYGFNPWPGELPRAVGADKKKKKKKKRLYIFEEKTKYKGLNILC